ncbi:MAG: DUF2341 domain-containing protein, partial [Bacteroidetes bacterium]|nr:DUF2341 domain-containing protein [Bacteroidota bacterium]
FAATPVNGGTTPSYQWLLNGASIGTDSLTYTEVSLINGDQVSCIITSNASCVTGSPATSNIIAMTVNGLMPSQPETITGNSFICVTSGQSYSISPIAGATTYTWSAPADASIVSGQGTTSITVDFGVSSGNVSVTAGNSCGTNTSSLSVAVCTLTGWQYRLPLLLSNTSGIALTDFQTKCTVVFVPGKMNSDFSDLRFVDSTCTPLSYWIESFSPSTSAEIWIKVPSIPVTGTTIFLCYGNNSATSSSDAPGTFDFYDVCNSSSSGWVATSEGSGTNTFDASNGYFRLLGRGLCCSSSWGSAVVKKSLPSPLISGSYVVSFQNRNTMGVCSGGSFSITGISGGNMSVTCNNGNYCNGQNDNMISFAGYTYGNGVSGSGNYYTSSTSSSFTQFDIKPMDITNKTATLYVNGSVKQTVSAGTVAPTLTTITLSSSNNGYSSSVNTEDFQNIIIRKYANPEPSVSFGIEINCP